MAAEVKPQSIPVTHTETPPSPSLLERLLRARVRMERAAAHYSRAADELQAARKELDKARVAMPASEARVEAVWLGARCKVRSLEAREHAETFASSARRAEALAEAARAMPAAAAQEGGAA
jgi:hypothetical protein